MNEPLKRKRPIAPSVNIISKPKTSSSFKNLPDTSTVGFTQKPADFIEAVQSLETGKKMFNCKFCGVQNQDKGNLGRHVLTKHFSNVPMVNCTLRNYQCKLKGDMKKHYMSKHSLPEALAKSALN